MSAPTLAPVPVMTGVELGVYEKALRFTGSFADLFSSARRAGYTFVDLSVDESAERLARLEWRGAQRALVRRAAARAGVRIGGLCLSAHRRIGAGSQDPATRARALDILVAGIDLCADLEIPVLQVAGYYAYYEPPSAGQRERYLETLAHGIAHAARCGVLLGLENVDGRDVTSITRALDIVDELGSPWLQLYPDIGNLAEQGLDVAAELRRGQGRMLAIHLKETRPGEPRRVAPGTGTVPWGEALDELARQRWSGRAMVEMWNDDSASSETIAAAARDFFAGRLQASGVSVLPATDRLLDIQGAIAHPADVPAMRSKGVAL